MVETGCRAAIDESLQYARSSVRHPSARVAVQRPHEENGPLNGTRRSDPTKRTGATTIVPSSSLPNSRARRPVSPVVTLARLMSSAASKMNVARTLWRFTSCWNLSAESSRDLEIRPASQSRPARAATHITNCGDDNLREVVRQNFVGADLYDSRPADARQRQQGAEIQVV